MENENLIEKLQEAVHLLATSTNTWDERLSDALGLLQTLNTQLTEPMRHQFHRWAAAKRLLDVGELEESDGKRFMVEIVDTYRELQNS